MDLLYTITGRLIAEGVTSQNYTKQLALDVTKECVSAKGIHLFIENTPEIDIVNSIKSMED